MSHIAVDGRGLLYATNPKRTGLRVFKRDGTLVREWGPTFKHILCFAISATEVFVSTTGSEDGKKIFVQVCFLLCSCLGLVSILFVLAQVFTHEGTLLREFAAKAMDIAFMRDGNLLVVDETRGSVQALTPNGEWITEFPERGVNKTLFRPGVFYPGRAQRVCVDRDGRIVVTGYAPVAVYAFEHTE